MNRHEMQPAICDGGRGAETCKRVRPPAGVVSHAPSPRSATAVSSPTGSWIAAATTCPATTAAAHDAEQRQPGDEVGGAIDRVHHEGQLRPRHAAQQRRVGGTGLLTHH